MKGYEMKKSSDDAHKRTRMSEEELKALWSALGMPFKFDDYNIPSEEWPVVYLDYGLLKHSPAFAFLFCINDQDATPEGGYLWHGICKGENLFNSRSVVDNYVKRGDGNKICVKQIGSDFIESVSDWAHWFGLGRYGDEVVFALASWNASKRIELRASVDWLLVSACCRGVQEEIYPMGWHNKSDAFIEPNKFMSDIMDAVEHKYQYEFEREWTFFITNEDGVIFPIKNWQDFHGRLRQCSDIQVQARLLNTDGADFQLEVKYSYCGGKTTLWGVGDCSGCAKDFVKWCLRYEGEIDDFGDTKFTLPLPVVKPEIVREY